MPEDDREKKTITTQIYTDQDEYLAEQARKKDRSKAYILRRIIDYFRNMTSNEADEVEKEQ